MSPDRLRLAYMGGVRLQTCAKYYQPVETITIERPQWVESGHLVTRATDLGERPIAFDVRLG